MRCSDSVAFFEMTRNFAFWNPFRIKDLFEHDIPWNRSAQPPANCCCPFGTNPGNRTNLPKKSLPVLRGDD